MWKERFRSLFKNEEPKTEITSQELYEKSAAHAKRVCGNYAILLSRYHRYDLIYPEGNDTRVGMAFENALESAIFYSLYHLKRRPIPENVYSEMDKEYKLKREREKEYLITIFPDEDPESCNKISIFQDIAHKRAREIFESYLNKTGIPVDKQIKSAIGQLSNLFERYKES